MSQNELLGPSSHRHHDGPHHTQNKIFEHVHKENEVKKELAKHRQQNTFTIEKVTWFRFFLFILYACSLLVIMNLRNSLLTQYSINKAMNRYFLNEDSEPFDSTVQTINGSKPAFSDVVDIPSLTSYIKNTLIYGSYQNNDGDIVQNDNDNTGITYYESISPIRILQNRAKLIQQPENLAFPTRWDLSHDKESKDTYGTPSYPIVYDHVQDGFPLILQVTINDFSETNNEFDLAVQNGFFDPQTREVRIHYAMYNSLAAMIVSLEINFEFTPTGRVIGSNEFFCFPVDFYAGSHGAIMLTFQIFFFLLFLYYLVQEFTKIYNQIRNASPVRRREDVARGGLAKVTAHAENFKERIVVIFKGLWNHIKNPWSFLDVVSLACSLIDIVIWLKLVQEDTVMKILDMTKAGSTMPDAEKMSVLYQFNMQLVDVVSQLVLYQQIAAVNILIMVLKMLKYVTRFNDKVKDQVQVIVGVTNRIIPFVVLLLTIMLSFVYLAYLLFGNSIEEFSSFFPAFRYFFTNVHNNFSEADAMVKVNTDLAVLFHVMFIFIIIFILSNMFFVYVIHAFKDYYMSRKIEKHEAKHHRSQFTFEAHPLWILKNFFTMKCRLACQKRFDKKHYQETIASMQEKNAKEERELSLYKHFNFDVNYKEESEENDQLNPIFNTDAAIEKATKQRKRHIVKLVWATVAIILVFAFLTMISLEHHRITTAEGLASNIGTLLESSSYRTMLPNGTIGTYGIGKNIYQLQSEADIKAWIVDYFQWFTVEGAGTLSDGRSFTGFFMAGNYLVISDMYRVTVRRRSVLPLDNDEFQNGNNITLTGSFNAKSKNPKGEHTDTFIGRSGAVYEYREDDGYRNAGGYVLETLVSDLGSVFTTAVDDDLIDYSLNSIVLDFGLYHAMARDALNIAIVFQMNPGSSFDIEVNVNYVGLNYYKTGYEYFICVLEITTAVLTAIFCYRILRNLRERAYNYSYWYTLHISHFPHVMKAQREKKMPEIVRKLRYYFKFSMLLDIIILGLIAASGIIWVVYVARIRATNQVVNAFLQKTPISTNSVLMNDLEVDYKILFALKLTESFTIFFVSLKLIYLYSNFAKFKFLINTLKNSMKWIPQMFVILMFVLIAFGFFLQLVVGATNLDYNTFFRMVAEQLQNLTQLKNSDKSIFTENYATFITLVYYFPWVILATCIVYNMFLGIIFTAYESVKVKKGKCVAKIGWKDFWTLTRDIIQRKAKPKQQQRIHFEVNEQTRASFNYQKIFEEFGGLVNHAASFTDPKVWATSCAKNIITEKEARKNMMKISEEITKASILDFDFKKHQHKKILSNTEKFSQFSLKMQYWKYFKHGQAKLLEFMYILNKATEQNDKVLGDVRTKKIQHAADEKIRKYILQLETEVAANFQEIQFMSKKVDEYKREKL